MAADDSNNPGAYGDPSIDGETSDAARFLGPDPGFGQAMNEPVGGYPGRAHERRLQRQSPGDDINAKLDQVLVMLAQLLSSRGGQMGDEPRQDRQPTPQHEESKGIPAAQFKSINEAAGVSDRFATQTKGFATQTKQFATQSTNFSQLESPDHRQQRQQSQQQDQQQKTQGQGDGGFGEALNKLKEELQQLRNTVGSKIEGLPALIRQELERDA